MIGTKNGRLAAALRYARRNWYVLPVHSIKDGHCTCGNRTCKSPGKHPGTRHGVKGASCSPEVIEHWWAVWPDANIAIATGSKFGIAVIDVAPRNKGIATLKVLEKTYGLLRDITTSIIDGGGRHFIYIAPRFQVRKDGLGQGIDVLSDGNYIVVPPSCHFIARIYT